MRALTFPTHLIGRRTLWFDEVESTNTLATSYATDTANDGLVLIADHQTAGRGRQGRTWLSPRGCGLLLSALLFPPARLRQPAALTALAAVAACDAIRQHAHLTPTIKWPNDLLVQGRKVCGILVEQGQGTVIGIGLNVLTPGEAFVAAGLPLAGSLRLFTDEPLDRQAIAESLLTALDASYQELLAGQFARLEEHWRAGLGLVGRDVIVLAQAGQERGRVVELTLNSVTLEGRDGERKRLQPEAIQQMTSLK
jgi:BirA family biotin operon repressor/biotin-[acetyl-CoA-carboxylase] ligase